MNLLIIGIDGATEWIFDLFDMPFWQQLKTNSTTLPLQEDIIQRGWAKMLSGMRATQTGGFYMYPRLDGTRNFTQSFGYRELSAAPGFVPVWRFPEDAGIPVGLMNIPTTHPAQKVKGFYVSGGGGGVFTGSLPENAVWPINAETILKKNNYIYDTRLGKQRFRNPQELCAHLIKMMNARTASFIELTKQHGIGFGFLAFRASAVIMYLAMCEIMEIVGNRKNVNKFEEDDNSAWALLLKRYFQALDQNLQALIETINPDHYMFVSDHNMVPYRYKADLNFFLVEQGFAWFKKDIKSVVKNIGKLMFLPRYRNAISACNSPAEKIKAILGRTNLHDKSLAFGNYYVHGLYINDERFGGPVHGSQIRSVSAEIIERFNQTPQARKYSLNAVPYRENFSKDAYAHLAPDIKIDQNWETFFANDVLTFIRPNENYSPVRSLKNVGGMHSGQKGEQPLLVIDHGLQAIIRKDDPMDLTLVHRLSKRLFSH